MPKNLDQAREWEIHKDSKPNNYFFANNAFTI